MSLVDYSQYDPALPAGNPFTSILTNGGNYWSSSSDASNLGYAWSINMLGGGVKSYKKYSNPVGGTIAGGILPVRDGQSAFAATAVLPRTGQTTCYDINGVVQACAGTGQDGDTLKGIAWPSPRFTDNNNGSITDNLTGLIWLKNANCFATKAYSGAITSANTLASGACGLADNSTAGQWRLPNITELESLIDESKYSPAVPAGHPFASIQNDYYWSSSYLAATPAYGWCINMNDGAMGYMMKQGEVSSYRHVWPVRGGQ